MAIRLQPRRRPRQLRGPRSIKPIPQRRYRGSRVADSPGLEFERQHRARSLNPGDPRCSTGDCHADGRPRRESECRGRPRIERRISADSWHRARYRRPCAHWRVGLRSEPPATSGHHERRRDNRSTAQDQSLSAPPANDAEAHFVSQILRSTEQVWTSVFRDRGLTYQDPKLVLFRDSYPTACGQGEAAAGPFYCSRDRRVYIDLSFFDELSRQLDGPASSRRLMSSATRWGITCRTFSASSIVSTESVRKPPRLSRTP